MKHWAIGNAILCLVAINLLAQPYHCAAEHQQTAASDTLHAITHQDSHKSSANADAAKTSPPKWYTPLQRSEWWLVIIAALTGCAIAYQAREMKRATEAMRDSTRLQEADLRQWVELVNWGAQVEGTEPYGYSTGGGKAYHNLKALGVRVFFDVANATPRPLTFIGARLNVAVAGRGLAGQEFLIEDKASVAPQGKHPCHVPLILKGDEIDRYFLDDLQISISGRIFFDDILGKRQEQGFGELINAGDHGTAILRYLGRTPTEQPEQDT